MIPYLCIGIHVALRLFGYCDFSFEIQICNLDHDSWEQRVAHVFKQWISGQGLCMIQLTIKSTH